MPTSPLPVEPASAVREGTNGSAMAAFLGAGIGAFAMGAIVLLNEAGIFAAPALYAPAGGVSGRTTLAGIVWVIGWGLLHTRWKAREIAPRRICAVTAALTGLGILATFPPLWGLL
jgi:hypothetical protein